MRQPVIIVADDIFAAMLGLPRDPKLAHRSTPDANAKKGLS